MEEDVKVLEEFIADYKIAEEIVDGNLIESIENILEERQQDKERIKELEDNIRGDEDK